MHWHTNELCRAIGELSFMHRLKTSLALLAALASSTHTLAGNYFSHKDVTSSPHYTGSSGAAQVQPVSSSEWLQQHAGNTAALGIGHQGFLIENAALNTVIYGITNRLLKEWPGTAPTLVIFIQGDRSPLSYGAATTHASEIFINYGVLLHAESEDELAAVIAHELGHVLLDHVKTLDYMKQMRNSVTVLGQARDLYATADAMGYNESTEQVTIDPEVGKGLKQSATQQMLAKQLYGGVHASLFSRSNEYDADRFAIDLLIAAGYSPMGLKTSLERLAHSYELSSDIANQLSASSQRLLAQHSAEFEQYASQKNNGDYDYSGALNQLKDDFGASAVDIGKKSLLKWGSRSHPVPDKRVKQLTDYVYDNYSRRERRRKLTRATMQQFRSGSLGKVLIHYQAANESMVAIGLDNTRVALDQAKLANSAPTRNEAYPLYAGFYTSSASGKLDAGQARALSQSGFVPIYASITIADTLANAGDLGQAMTTVANTESLFGTLADFYPIKIKAAAGDSAQAELLAQACFDSPEADDALINSCAQLAGVPVPKATERGVPGAINKFGKSLLGTTNSLFGKDK